MTEDWDEKAARLAAIVESSDDAIVSKDLNGVVTTWNRAAERLFGYTAAEMIGQSIRRIIPEDRHGEEDYVLSRVRAGLSVDHFETVRQRKDGSLIDISLTVSPVRGPEGRIAGISKIARDITEQKRLRRAAEETSRAKDEFLATLSHELRTPLNTVLGYTHMLQTGALDERELPRALETISRNAELLTRLVNDVLETSRIVTGKVRLQIQPCDIGGIAEEAIATIMPAADAKALEVRARIAHGLIVHGDPDRLRQVLWNLLSNAVKFTPEHGTLCVSTERLGRSIKLVVEDTGIGIAATALPMIFQRFWQEDASHTSGHGGLGLGLALVRHFVELHGGEIHAYSEGPGRGARFEIALPDGAAADPVDVSVA
jgi:PAS domain S-box-containing protein